MGNRAAPTLSNINEASTPGCQATKVPAPDLRAREPGGAVKSGSAHFGRAYLEAGQCILAERTAERHVGCAVASCNDHLHRAAARCA